MEPPTSPGWGCRRSYPSLGSVRPASHTNRPLRAHRTSSRREGHRSGAPPSGRPGSGTLHRAGGASRDGRTPRRRVFPGRPAGRICPGGFRASPRLSVHHTIRSASSPGSGRGVCSPHTGGRRRNRDSTPKTNFSLLRVLSSWRWAIPRRPLRATAPARFSRKRGRRGRCASTRVGLGSLSPARLGVASAPP
jgi:hypothetical protein